MKDLNEILSFVDEYKLELENQYEDLLKDLNSELLLNAKDSYISIVNVNSYEILKELEIVLNDYFNNKIIRDLKKSIKEYSELLKDQIEWSIDNYGNIVSIVDSVNNYHKYLNELFSHDYPEILKGILKNNFNKVGNKNIKVPDILINIKKLNMDFSNIIDRLSLKYTNKSMLIDIHTNFISKIRNIELDKIEIENNIPEYLNNFNEIINLCNYKVVFKNRILYFEKNNEKYRTIFDHDNNTLYINDGYNSMIKCTKYEKICIDNKDRVIISKNNENIYIENIKLNKKIVIIKTENTYSIADENLELIKDSKEIVELIDFIKEYALGCYNMLMKDENFLKQYNDEKDNVLFQNVPKSKLRELELEFLKKDKEVKRYIELEEKK